MEETAARRPFQLPPLWLSAAAVAGGWATIFSIKRWIDHYRADPAFDDFRVYYYVAKIGLQHGWNQIYNQDLLRSVMAAHFTGAEAVIDGLHTYPNPPTFAWLVAPLTVFPLGPAYLVWSLFGLGCVIAAWYLAAPFTGLGRVTLLLLAVAIWPVHYSLFFGQPTPEIMALVAAAWWFVKRDQAAPAGIALALAASLKPQDVVLLPLVLLVSGRVSVFVWCAISSAVLGAIFFASLGISGVNDFWQTTLMVENTQGHIFLTLAALVGPGLYATAGQALLAAATLVAAWRRRMHLELVFAIGLTGSIVTAVHAHESEFCMIVLAAWLAMRSPIGVASRAWMVVGIAAVQTMAVGWGTPVLLWDLAWLALLAVDRVPAPGEARAGLHRRKPVISTEASRP